MWTSPPRWLRIVAIIIAIVVGVVLMGGKSDSSTRMEEWFAIIGIAVIVGGWLWATRETTASTGRAINERALKEINVSLETYETHGLLHKKGETLIALGRYKDAVQPLQRATELDGSDIHTRYLLGQALFVTKDYKGAWREFDIVFRADKSHDYGEIRLWAARTFIALGDADHAEKVIDSFLAEQPGHLGGLALKADALWAQESKRDAAIAAYREFLAVYSQTVEFGQRRYAAEATVARKRVR